MCVHVKRGGCFLWKAKGNSLPSTSHSPRMRGVNHPGAAGRRERHYQLGKSGRDPRKSGQETIRVQQRQVPPVSACSLMWNSCRQGLTSCVLTHKTHFRDDGSTSTLPVVFLELSGGNETPYHQTSPSSLHPDENHLYAASAATNLSGIVPVPFSHHQKHKPS